MNDPLLFNSMLCYVLTSCRLEREILCKICNSQKFVAEPSWHCWPSPSLQNNHSTPLQTILENLPQILFPLKLKYCLFVLKIIISQLPSRFPIFFLFFFINCKKWKKCTLNTIFVRLQMHNYCRIKERLRIIVMFLGSSWVCLMKLILIFSYKNTSQNRNTVGCSNGLWPDMKLEQDR